MVTTWSGLRRSPEKYSQQELSVLFPHLSLSISNQGQVQEIMAAAPYGGLQEPYLFTIDCTTSEDLKLYNKAMVVLPESGRYDLTRSKWTNFYQ